MYVLCGSCYEQGWTGSMAEEGSVYELDGLETQFQSLLSRYSSDELRADGKPFCSDFCKLVEEYACRWQVPLPQLGILELALRYFARASTFFTPNCDHVLHTLSSLALSVFELLLFFDQPDFNQEPLKNFSITFQECHLVLARHQNVHLLQVECLVQGGGPWASSVLQAILSDSNLPQNEVDGCISSELPVFLELRVRYLLSCKQVSEAMALAKCCARHPTAGQHLFFHQVYLKWLYKTSQHDCLHKEVDDLGGKDAVHIICSLECDEKDDLLLALSRAFLSQQLRRGDMYYLCDLVFVWSKLHSRLNTSKQALLEESHQLMLSATNVNSIFPFIRAILKELGEDGKQFCVELCAKALESCLPCDVVTKSLIYKTIAGLLPNDLEVCRACALLVFFSERTVDTYKIVYLLYMHPDQEYHVEHSPIANHVRFEMLQVLKKDLYFDPEFWNLIALRTNCLKLMSERGVSPLEEIMEDKWILNYCTKEPAFRSSKSCQKGRKGSLQAAAKKRHHKEERHHEEDSDTASKRLKMGPGKTRLNDDHTVRKKGLRSLKDASSEPLRRSFWQLDKKQDSVTIRCGEHRRTTRLSEKNPPKRRIRKPKWLLEDSGTREENNVPTKIKKQELTHQKHHRSCVVKRLETGQIKNSEKHEASVNSHLKAREVNKHQRGFSLDCLQPAPTPQVVLELSLPDNELMGSFSEDSCNRQRGFPQVLLYKPTVKLPTTSQPAKTVHRKEVILRARDETMFIQLLHCYAPRQKGKGNGSNVHGSVSTITRSSVQGSPPKNPRRERCGKPDVRFGGASHRRAGADVTASPVLEKAHQEQTTKAVSRMTSAARELHKKPAAKVKAELTEAPVSEKVLQAEAIPSTRELCEEPAVEMKVTIASKTSANLKNQIAASAEVAPTTTADNCQNVVVDKTHPVSNTATDPNLGAAHPASSPSQDVVGRDEDTESLAAKAGKVPVAQAKVETPEVPRNNVAEDLSDSKGHAPGKKDTVSPSKVPESRATYSPADQDSINDISALTLVTEMVSELAPEALAHDMESDKRRPPENSASEESTARSKQKVPQQIRSTSSCSVQAQEASAVADVQLKRGKEGPQDIDPETLEEDDEDQPETEESKLEYCCTFCNKDFKGSRVVAHAMFHYRKDECMFCGTMFKDDLLAMMHLSDHIEKLKKIKESAGDKVQENRVSETKGFSTPLTPSKDKTTNMSSARRGRGRPRKTAESPESVSLQDVRPSESRKLRSKDKTVDGNVLQEKKQNTSKHRNSETRVHKVNGHVGKKKTDKIKKDSEPKQPLTQQELSQERPVNGSENPGFSENQDGEMDSSASSIRVEKGPGGSSEYKNEKESLQFLKAATKQNEEAVEEKDGEPQEKVRCPVDGCVWFKDLSKNRVALLYHALDDHYGEPEPLELAFRIGKSRCAICMRVLWSFEHFQHHVERHRLAPRHPCLHQGCTVRFKTGNEMRRHARRHSPLQAVCCLPGCSQLFICLWALNLHEREHYASRPTKPDKIAALGKKQQDHEPKDATAVNKTVSLKASRKLRGQATHNTSPRRHAEAPLLSSVRTSESKETEDSNVLKNLSNKDTSAQPTVPNLRLRQTLRKASAPKTHRVISSSLLKLNNRVRHKLKKHQVKVNAKGPKRRGRPPKIKKDVPDENMSSGPNSETVKDKTSPPKDPNVPAELSSPLKAPVTSDVSNSERDQDVKTTETSVDESTCKKSVSKQFKKSHVKHKGSSHNTSTSNSLNPPIGTTSADEAQKFTADRKRKMHKAKKRSAPKENGSKTSDSSESKRHKVRNGKVNTKAVKKKINLKEAESASKTTAKAAAAVPHVEAKAAVVESSADEDGKAKTQNADSTQSGTGDTVPAVAANEATAPSTTLGEEVQRVTKEEKSKKPKEKITKTASSDSGKVKKKCKDINKKTDKEKQARTGETSAPKKTKKSKSVVQQQDRETKAAAVVESSTLDEVGKVTEEAADATHSSSDPSVPAVPSCSNEKTSPPTATEENTQEVKPAKKLKKSNGGKNSDPNKASKKRKNILKGDTKIVKKSKDDGVLLAKSETDLEDRSAGETLAQSPPCPISGPGYYLMNGQASGQDVISSVTKDALALYGKRPYMRIPPTAYLDEKYITMPKRRKEMSLFQSPVHTPPPGPARVAAALQRQRCANCFATFNSAEDLQGHLQLQKCSNLFGFDSDDEGNS